MTERTIEDRIRETLGIPRHLAEDVAVPPVEGLSESRISQDLKDGKLHAGEHGEAK